MRVRGSLALVAALAIGVGAQGSGAGEPSRGDRSKQGGTVPAASGAAPEVVDPVYVFYPRGSCREETIELEVWDREDRVWRDHPRHPRVPVESCQLEDAGILFQEIRWRCVETRPTDLPPAWVVGLDVFNPRVMERCAVDAPASHESVEIRIHEPRPDQTVRNRESRATVAGSVHLDGVAGFVYDVVIALDVSQATGARSNGPDLFNAQLDAALDLAARLRTRLGPVRVGVVTFPNTQLSKNAAGGTGARREIGLSDDPAAIDRALRSVRSRGPSSFQSFSSGFPFAVRELLGENPGGSARPDVRKVLILAADGRSDVPFGAAEAATPRFLEKVTAAVDRAKAAGVETHFFALGGVAGEAPAWMSELIAGGGSFRRVPEPRLGTAFLQLVSLPFVSDVEVTDLRTGEAAKDLRLEPDGTFRASVPVRGGPNPVRVTATSSEGLRGQREIVVDFDDSLVREELRAAERERMERLRREGRVEIEADEPSDRP